MLRKVAYGKGMETVSDELADRAMELGYLADGGQITLTVDSGKDGWKTAAEELLLLELEVHFEHRVTVMVGGRQPSAGRESQNEIVIAPSQPDEEDDSDDDPHEDDRGDDDATKSAVSASENADDSDWQDDKPPASESDDLDDDDEDSERPDDNTDDGDSDDDSEHEDD